MSADMTPSVLIANRGEIVRRVERAATRIGFNTVAVYSEADRAAPFVREATNAVLIGPPSAQQSYLNQTAILQAAAETGATCIHPGYGFLSENAEFARSVEAAGMAFVGPTPRQISEFGDKHSARKLAAKANVPMLPGTGVLASADDATASAERIGYPVILKATNGGGGIGMRVCRTTVEVQVAYSEISVQAERNFGSGDIYLERYVSPARHVEVQLFGDGLGNVAILGDRDCSMQRRNQKVVEECPAPNLPDHVRTMIHDAARNLAASVQYRSAGTVEFVYDAALEQAYFLEMNTRLQVEHPVTEEVFGIDLVEAMLRLAQFGPDDEWLQTEMFNRPFTPEGHAIEARIYAEDPAKASAPCPGLLTNVEFPGDHGEPMSGIRVESGVETGTEVSPNYDPMLAKLIAVGPTRDDAIERFGEAIAQTHIDGVVTNCGLVRDIVASPEFETVAHSTSTLAKTWDPDPRIDVIDPGMFTTVQDIPGRLGHWQVGVPPSGPMDSASSAAANRAVGNPEGAPLLECTLQGPTLKFSDAVTVCVAGAPAQVTVDDVLVPMWEPIQVKANSELVVGAPVDLGMRTYIAVRGGIDVPKYLGSASTFVLGKFGGHGGRVLRPGDVLRPGSPDSDDEHRAFPDGSSLGLVRDTTPLNERPHFTHSWQIGVTEGPHGADEFFTRADMNTFYTTNYKVHFNSDRTGIRLVGPHPKWSRPDGGEAGLHPSNIHDTPYAVGALDFTGDTPIILGPDGPSLGGFVCPVVIATTELWKIGQLRPDDTVQFVRVAEAVVPELSVSAATIMAGSVDGDDGIIALLPETAQRPTVTYRRDGDDNVLVEYGPQVLDIALRMRVHALMERIEETHIDGIIDLTPGIRSLQVHTDTRVITATQMANRLIELENTVPDTDDLVVPSRIVRLPLSWDDPATRLAIERYMNVVRDDAPWCPWNIEFIRRVNGLDTVDDVYRTVFDATYLVLGLGDVYLGAPVATPLDPRHRLVTTKYNPARTWTAENSVGIGGAYLCIYGMEGPGGYQFVGRTVQVWNRFRARGMFTEQPWSLRFFDRIQWYPVSADELLELREEMDAGRASFPVEESTFSYAEYKVFLDEHAESIAEFKHTQQAAFAAEEARWRASGGFDVQANVPDAVPNPEVVVPDGCTAVRAPFTANVWKFDVKEGDTVTVGEALLSLEAMKMETAIKAPTAGSVKQLNVDAGDQVQAGQVLMLIEDES